MKNLTIILVVLCLTLVPAVEAQAGLLSLFKKDKDQKDSEVQAPRYDKYPTMDFFVGTLTRSGWSDWQIGDAEVEIDESGLTNLREGSQAIIMGAMVGDKIMAHRVRVLEPQWSVPIADNQEDIRWSTTDPTVGEGTGPN